MNLVLLISLLLFPAFAQPPAHSFAVKTLIHFNPELAPFASQLERLEWHVGPADVHANERTVLKIETSRTFGDLKVSMWQWDKMGFGLPLWIELNNVKTFADPKVHQLQFFISETVEELKRIESSGSYEVFSIGSPSFTHYDAGPRAEWNVTTAGSRHTAEFTFKFFDLFTRKLNMGKLILDPQWRPNGETQDILAYGNTEIYFRRFFKPNENQVEVIFGWQFPREFKFSSNTCASLMGHANNFLQAAQVKLRAIPQPSYASFVVNVPPEEKHPVAWAKARVQAMLKEYKSNP